MHEHVQTYSKMEAKKAELTKQMSQTVFDISMDAQEGAIYSVLDEMADQFVKEMLLAYFLLLKHKYPATEVRSQSLQQFLALPHTPPCSPCALAASVKVSRPSALESPTLRGLWLSGPALLGTPCCTTWVQLGFRVVLWLIVVDAGTRVPRIGVVVHRFVTVPSIVCRTS